MDDMQTQSISPAVQALQSELHAIEEDARQLLEEVQAVQRDMSEQA